MGAPVGGLIPPACGPEAPGVALLTSASGPGVPARPLRSQILLPPGAQLCFLCVCSADLLELIVLSGFGFQFSRYTCLKILLTLLSVVYCVLTKAGKIVLNNGGYCSPGF